MKLLSNEFIQCMCYIKETLILADSTYSKFYPGTKFSEFACELNNYFQSTTIGEIRNTAYFIDIPILTIIIACKKFFNLTHIETRE